MTQVIEEDTPTLQTTYDGVSDPVPLLADTLPAVGAVSDEMLAWDAGFEERYQERESIARGGMGEIQALWDARIGREVAIKLIRSENASSVEHRARFVREACLQGRLEHPSIVPVHDIGITPQGQLYFTMKRVRGMTLKEIVSRLRTNEEPVVSRFSRRRLLTAFSNVCLTIAFAHDHGVVHRDLKPSNIMLGDFGETYVLDWGLSKYIGEAIPTPAERSEESIVETRTGFVFGTPGFMSPEQLTGAVEAVGPLVDVYALGAILFEILTLTPLYRVDQSRAAIMRATLDGVEARPSVRCPSAEVPPELEAIILKATAYRVEDRYPTVRALHDALERFLDGERDLTVRAELAAACASSAVSALASTQAGAPAEEVVGTAMREVGRALALDAGNASALSTLTKILIDPPRELPREAREELRAAQVRAARSEELWAAGVYASCFLSVGAMVWMGVREWSFIGVTLLSLSCLTGLSLYAARAEPRREWLVYVRLVISMCGVAFGMRFMGPVVFLPGVLVVLAASFALKPSPILRWTASGAAMLAIAVPLGLEWGSVIAPSYVFKEGMMCILPRALELSPSQTLFTLGFTACGLIFIQGAFVGRVREELSAAQRRLHSQNWLLRQLMPPAAHAESAILDAR